MRIGEKIMIRKQNFYGQSIISGDDTDYEILQRRENLRKQSPTSDQIKVLKRYLKDFQIKVHIPQFNTVAEMETWKIKQVKTKLGR